MGQNGFGGARTRATLDTHNYEILRKSEAVRDKISGIPADLASLMHHDDKFCYGIL